MSAPKRSSHYASSQVLNLPLRVSLLLLLLLLSCGISAAAGRPPPAPAPGEEEAVVRDYGDYYHCAPGRGQDHTVCVSAVTLIITATATMVLGAAIAAGICCWCCWDAFKQFAGKYHRRRKKVQSEASRTFEYDSPRSFRSYTLNAFSFEDIKAATNNFAADHIVGVGAFGCVYRGRLQDGSLIAVKRFKNCSPDGDAEFVNEAHMISSVRHRNLVVLRGSCVAREVDSSGHGHQRFLVYDYMANGSLDDVLTDKSRPALSWEQRRRITIGTGRAICYLHRGAKPAIIHRDVKGSNILLDEQFCPKLADFGLAKVTPEGASHVTTRVAGTHGYVAPEYAMYGRLTERSDVYSFGVVLLELITGMLVLVGKSTAAARTPHPCLCLAPPCLLPDWVWAMMKRGNLLEVVDPRIRADLSPEEVAEVERFIQIGLLCAHPHMSNRPTMHQALRLLEGDAPLPRTLPDRPLPLNSKGQLEDDLKLLGAATAPSG